MSKLLILILTVSFANAIDDKSIVEFLKLSSNKNVKVTSVEVIDKKEIEGATGWYAYFVMIDLNVKGKTGVIKQQDIIFTNGRYLTGNFVDMKRKKMLKNLVMPDFNPKYYKKENLLYGNENAKHKIVLFSDPQCPFCIDDTPFLIDFVKKHKEFALYYFHLPLNIHPSAKIIVKAILAAEKKGIKDILKRTYKVALDTKSTNEDEVLKIFNQKLKTDITKEEINQPEIINRLNNDAIVAKQLFVKGTPTLFLDNIYDPTRSKHEKLVEKKK